MGKIAWKGILTMTTLFEPAYAKVNLTLDVLGKRDDGYHDLKSVMQTISVRDDIEIDVGTGKPWVLHCTNENIPTDERNLAWKAAKVYFDTAQGNVAFFRFRAGLTLRDGEDTAYIAAKKYIVEESRIITDFFNKASQHIGNIRGKEILCTISFIGTINATISSYLQTGDEQLVSDDTIYRLRQQFLYGIYS